MLDRPGEWDRLRLQNHVSSSIDQLQMHEYLQPDYRGVSNESECPGSNLRYLLMKRTGYSSIIITGVIVSVVWKPYRSCTITSKIHFAKKSMRSAVCGRNQYAL